MDTCNKHFRSSWDAHKEQGIYKARMSKEYHCPNTEYWTHRFGPPRILLQCWKMWPSLHRRTIQKSISLSPISDVDYDSLLQNSHYTLPALSTFHGVVGSGAPSESQPRRNWSWWTKLTANSNVSTLHHKLPQVKICGISQLHLQSRWWLQSLQSARSLKCAKLNIAKHTNHGMIENKWRNNLNAEWW